MFHAFLDESYTAERYYIAAAVGDEAAWECVEGKLSGIRQLNHKLHGLPLDVEFHADEMMNGRGEWAPLKGKHREAGAIYAAVLDAARECGVRVILRGLDIPRLHARYSYPDQPHALVLQHTLERLNERSRDYHWGEMITVTADEVATQAQHVTQFEGYKRWGTRGYRASNLPYICSPITFAPSHSANGLQIADFAAYLHRRRRTVAERHPAARRAMKRLSSKLDALTIHEHTWHP